VLVPEITATHWRPPASLLMSSPPTAPSNLCCLMFPAGFGVESIGKAVHVAGKHLLALGGSDTTRHHPDMAVLHGSSPKGANPPLPNW
jgi:hypothetical protein